MKNRDYPVILGLKRNGGFTKAALGYKAPDGGGYDVGIFGLKEEKSKNDIKSCSNSELANTLDGRVYTVLRFTTMESLDDMIHLLQDIKGLWMMEQKGKDNNMEETKMDEISLETRYVKGIAAV